MSAPERDHPLCLHKGYVNRGSEVLSDHVVSNVKCLGGNRLCESVPW